MHSTIGMASVMFSMSRPGEESLETSRALSRPPTRASCPPPGATIASPAAEVKRLREGEAPWSEAQEPIREASELLRGCSGGAGTGQVQDNFVSIHIILLHRSFTSGTLLPGQHQKRE